MNASDENLKLVDNRIIHNINIGETLHQKLNKHIKILKNLDDRSTSKQTWLVKAFKNKLSSTDKELLVTQPKQRKLSVKIDKKLSDEIDDHVVTLKKFNFSYSKTKWILEAVQEQLEKESEKIKNLLNNT